MRAHCKTHDMTTEVGPPSQVDEAFKDVASAKEDRERLINEARGYQNDVIPKARGEAQRLIKQAEAYRVERIARAEGDADRFRSVYVEYKKAPSVTEKRLYLETMEKILAGMNKVLIDSSSQGGQGVVPYLPLPELDRRRQRAEGSSSQ